MTEPSAPASSAGAKVFVALREVLGLVPLTVFAVGVMLVGTALASSAQTREIVANGRTETATVTSIRELRSVGRGPRSVSYCARVEWSVGTTVVSGELPCSEKIADYRHGDVVTVRYVEREPELVLDADAIPDEGGGFLLGGSLIAIGLPLTILSARDAQRRARKRRDIRRARRDGRMPPARHLASSDD